MQIERPFFRFVGEPIIPTVYEEALSYGEQLRRLTHALNKVIDIVNNWDKNIDESVVREIHRLKETGELAEIINEELFNALDERIETLENWKPSITQQVTTNTNDITQLKRNANTRAIDLRHCVVVGDSYVEGVHTGEYVDSWAVQLKNMLPNSTFHISAQGGCGYVKEYNAKTFPILIANLAVSMTSAQREDVTSVLIMGGYNDKDQSGVANAMYATLVNTKGYFPNAQIVLIANPMPMIFPSNIIRDFSYAIDNFNLTANRKAIFLEGSQTWGIGRESVGWFDEDEPTVLHPNYNFHTLIANRVLEWSITGTPIISKWQENITALCGDNSLFTFSYDGKTISIDMYLNDVPTSFNNVQKQIVQLPYWLRQNYSRVREWNPVICNNTGTVTANIQKKSDGYIYFQRSNFDSDEYGYTCHLLYSADAWY